MRAHYWHAMQLKILLLRSYLKTASKKISRMKLANYSQRYMTTSPLTLYLRQQQEQLLVKHCSSITYTYPTFFRIWTGKRVCQIVSWTSLACKHSSVQLETRTFWTCSLISYRLHIESMTCRGAVWSDGVKGFGGVGEELFGYKSTKDKLADTIVKYFCSLLDCLFTSSI